MGMGDGGGRFKATGDSNGGTGRDKGRRNASRNASRNANGREGAEEFTRETKRTTNAQVKIDRVGCLWHHDRVYASLNEQGASAKYRKYRMSTYGCVLRVAIGRNKEGMVEGDERVESLRLGILIATRQRRKCRRRVGHEGDKAGRW
jgi:hypothetical protein